MACRSSSARLSNGAATWGAHDRSAGASLVQVESESQESCAPASMQRQGDWSNRVHDDQTGRLYPGGVQFVRDELYHKSMLSVTLSQFRNKQSDYIAAAQHEPVEITSRGTGRRAVIVSPEFYDRAMQALEDQADIRAAAEARAEGDRVAHEELVREIGT